MARTQLPNLVLPRSPEDGLAGSGSAFDKQFTAGRGHEDAVANCEEIWWTLAGPFAVGENRWALVAFRRRFGLAFEAVEEIGAEAVPVRVFPAAACEREYQHLVPY
jgi:hypothetical protein